MITVDKMSKKELVYWHNYIWKKYCGAIKLIFSKKEQSHWSSIVKDRKIYAPYRCKKNQSEWSLFSFLHEIGHVMTNDPNTLELWKLEYDASKWAVDEARNLGLVFSNHEKEREQNYIWEWWEFSKGLGQKVPPKKDLILKW